MSQLNQLFLFESSLPKKEMDFLSSNLPQFLKVLQLQQTVINQLNIRTGGTGSGSDTTALNTLTSYVTELQNLEGYDQPALAAEAIDLAESAINLAAFWPVITDLQAKIEVLESLIENRNNGAIDELRSRIEAIENGSNA